MKVDSNWQRLQNLIEQKRIENNIYHDARSRISGRPGNPRFAAAAQRAQEAIQRRRGATGIEALGQESSMRREIALRVSEESRLPGIDSIGAGGLLSAFRQSNVLSGDSDPEIARPVAHLGRNIDLYA